MDQRIIHIVNHTHWDREWYFSTCDSTVLLDQTFSDILEELLSNPHVNFCFDGQISIIQDYLELYPNKKEVFQKLIDEKRIFVGPWYTQTDTQLVSVSSIINNMYYGIYDTQHLFGTYMKIGYLPDTFGFSNQLPMIFHQFHIDKAIFWRGIDFKEQNLSPYFYWKGLDGSRVITANLLKGYAMAQGFNTSQDFLEKTYLPIIRQYCELTSSPHLLLPVGGDQNSIVKNIDQKIKKFPGRLQISHYEAFMDLIKNETTQEYIGEFRKTRTSRLHKSAGSIRVQIKKSNYEAEMMLTRALEPINIMASYEGFAMSHRLIEKAWKLLFEGQAHDGIVGCVSDSVAEDIINRNKKSLEISRSALNVLKKQYAWSIGLKEHDILIFNPLPFEFLGYKIIEVVTHDEFIEIEGVEECTIIKTRQQKGYPHAMVETPEGQFYVQEEDYYFHQVLIKVKLPAMGYKVFSFHAAKPTTVNDQGQTMVQGEVEISFVSHQLNLIYQGQLIEDFISLIDQGNDGDTYDFSPLENDREISLKMQKATVQRYRDVQIMTIDCTTKLPYDLDDRLSQRHTQECACQLVIKLLPHSQIYVDIDFDNQVLSHKLCLKIRSLHAQKQTLAATPGGYILRDIMTLKHYPHWQKTHVECPIDIETNSGFVGFYGEGKQLFVFNKGLKEYQAQEDSLSLTLFATCGELGKPDLLYRPGRASGETTRKGHNRIPTPLAQEQYQHHFECMITFQECCVEKLYRDLQLFEEPSIYYQLQNINYFVERIDNKIQKINEDPKALPLEKSYFSLPCQLYVLGTYTSLFDQNIYTRFMIFHDQNIKDLFKEDRYIGNLLEEKEEDDNLKALRIYTVKGKTYENQ